VNNLNELLGGLGAKLVTVKVGDAATLLRCELRLYMTEPAHPQSSDAIDELIDMFGSVFFQFLWKFHFGPKRLSLIGAAAKPGAAGKKSPSGELGGLSWGF
jgi:hypothetical protein